MGLCRYTGLHRDYIMGIMERKMETTIMGYIEGLGLKF